MCYIFFGLMTNWFFRIYLIPVSSITSPIGSITCAALCIMLQSYLIVVSQCVLKATIACQNF